MASSNTKRKLISMGVFAAPVILVLGAKLYLGSPGPSAAQATPVEQVTTDKKKKPIVAPTYSTRQKAAAEYIRRIGSQALAGCPFLYEQRQTQPEQTPGTEPVASVYVDPAAPAFTVQAILSSSSGKTALIDGKACREGQKVRGTEWEVLKIDSDARSVTLRDSSSQRTITVQVEAPKLGTSE
jgi:hypothetical protein